MSFFYFASILPKKKCFYVDTVSLSVVRDFHGFGMKKGLPQVSELCGHVCRVASSVTNERLFLKERFCVRRYFYCQITTNTLS